VIYKFIITGESSFAVGVTIILGSFAGVVLGAVGTSDKNPAGSERIIAVLGIALNAIWLIGTLFLMGARISPHASLF